MKKLLIRFALVATLFIPTVAQSAIVAANTPASSVTNAVTEVKDSAINANHKAKIALKKEKIGNYIDQRLDDTIVESSNVANEKNEPQKQFEIKAQIDDNGVPMSVVAIVAIVFGSLLLAVVAICIAWYLFRRRKYKVIEQAIQHNYPLPSAVLGGGYDFTSGTTKKSTKAHRQRTTEEWGTFKSGIIWIAWGVGSVVFFSDTPMLAAGLILLIIGLGKIYVAYMNNKAISMMNQPTEKEEETTGSVPTPPPFKQNVQPTTNQDFSQAGEESK